MMAVQAQVSPVNTKRRNSMIAKTCACLALGGASAFSHRSNSDSPPLSASARRRPPIQRAPPLAYSSLADPRPRCPSDRHPRLVHDPNRVRLEFGSNLRRIPGTSFSSKVWPLAAPTSRLFGAQGGGGAGSGSPAGGEECAGRRDDESAQEQRDEHGQVVDRDVVGRDGGAGGL